MDIISKKNSISVDRQNLRDSYNAYVRAKQIVKKEISVCVFTEGGIPKPEVRLRRFKNGAFKIALESGIDILPVVIYDNKKDFLGLISKGPQVFLELDILIQYKSEILTKMI